MAYEIYQPERGSRHPIRGVLFDMDGLVLDSEKLYSRFWQEACRFYGFPMTYEQSLGMRALNAKAGEAMLRRYFGPSVNYMDVRTKRVELMDVFVQENGVEIKPGIFELLDYLKTRGIATAIASSSPLPRIQDHLSRHGLDTRFDALCSGHDVSCGKPAPDIYLHAAAVIGLPPEECLALEDAPAGLLSAHRAGCLPVMIPDELQPDEETRSLLYAKADSLTDIISLLDALE